MGKHHRERLRKKARENFELLEPHEIMELMLFYTYARVDTNSIAHDLLNQFGSINHVCNAPREELIKIHGVGERAADFITLLPHFVRAYEQSFFTEKIVFESSKTWGAYCIALMLGLVNEVVYVLCLDCKRRLIKCPKIVQGTPEEVFLEPRAVVEKVLHTAATQVVLCHNHPAGSLMPSENDLSTTAKVAKALEAVGIRLLDHVIVANGNYISLRDENFRF